MSSDNIQRQMEFIIEQQAKFSTDIAQLEQQNRQNTENIARLADVVLSLANIVERHDAAIAELIEQGKDTDRRLKATDERMKETDERMNALITTVEKFISGRNGTER
jgi:hypothetical protein